MFKEGQKDMLVKFKLLEENLYICIIVIFYQNLILSSLIMAKQSNNSTATIKGIIYQFLIALEKCFELGKDESVYIETFGDVSVLGENSKQIESKYHKGYLNDLDHNVWNTLNNWIKDEFPLDQFKSLVLLTTQAVKTDSPWYGWNEKNLAQKKLSLTTIQKKFLRQKKQGEETAKLLSSVFESQKENKLDNVLAKFVIDHNSKGDNALFDFIKDKWAKGIPDTRKNDFIKSLFGYITNPKAIENNNWSISYTEFDQEVKNLTSRLVETTTAFPQRIEIENIKEENFVDSLFINKIKEINYDEVIPNAISEYVQARELIIREFRHSPTLHKALDEYEKEISRIFEYKHRSASRKCTVDIHNESQDFFDEMMIHEYGTFHIYSTVPSYFDGGLLHNLADEDTLNLRWLLTPKTKNNE